MCVIEVPPSGASAPQRHLYEEVFYVLDGRGSTTIETPGGRKHSFEWGPRSLFAIPLNPRYRLFNASGTEPARLGSPANLPPGRNRFQDEASRFGTDWYFKPRGGPPTCCH